MIHQPENCWNTAVWGWFPRSNSHYSSDVTTRGHSNSSRIFHYIPINIPLVSSQWFEPLWNILVSWDDEIPDIWKVIIHSCSKPPTRYPFFQWFSKLSPLQPKAPKRLHPQRRQVWGKPLWRNGQSCPGSECQVRRNDGVGPLKKW